MRFTRPLAVLAVASLAIASAAVALEPSDSATTKPADSGSAKSSAKEKPVRLTVPWNKVKDLSDDQKVQINTIHVETVAKIKALEAEEDEKCMAVLTEDQRKAMAETLEQEKADKKASKGKKE
jgi:Spy/CpxP family protein refolding chaperone